MELVSLAINPIPGGAETLGFAGYDGLQLRAALWGPTRGDGRGTVCVFPGRSEYIEKYFEVVADLRRRGFHVAVLDWRGQGGSERCLANARKGYVKGFVEYEKDLKIFMDTVVKPKCPPPYVALGHSMAGNILLRGAQNPECPFARMVLVSPMIALDDRILGHNRKLVRIYSELACLFGFGSTYVRGGSDEMMDNKHFENNRLTSDFVRWSRNKAIMDQAPELGLGSATVMWLRSALRSSAMLMSEDYPKYVEVPTLIFSATRDRVVSKTAIEDFAVDLKVGGLIIMPESRHEILQENDEIRQRFWSAFDAYMDSDRDSAQQVAVST